MKMAQGTRTLFLWAWLAGAFATAAAASSWAGIYGGPKNEWGNGIIATSDGGYLVTGETDSYGAGGVDALVMKLDAQGSIQWARVMGGALDDYFMGALEMPEGGYVVAGGSYSFTTGSSARTCAPWLVRLDSSGNVLWQKYYACPLAAAAFQVARTRDGGFILCGHWWDQTQVMSGFLMKVTASGDPVWQTAYGPADNESFNGVLELSDGNILAAGIAFNSAIVANEGTLLKVDATGSPVWERRFEIVHSNGSLDAHPSALLETPDGGVLFGGGDPGQIRKLDKDGNTLWSQRVNAPFDPIVLNAPVEALAMAPEGGYYALGYYLCVDDPYCPPPLLEGSLLAKLSADGSLQWAKVYTGYPWILETLSVCAGQGGGVAISGSQLLYGGFSNLPIVQVDSDGSLSDPCLVAYDMPAPWTGEPSQDDWKAKVATQVACTGLVATPTISTPPLNSSNTYCPTIKSVTILQNPFRLDVKGLGYTQGEVLYVEGQRVPITKLLTEYELVAKKGAALKDMLPKGQPVCVQVVDAFHSNYQSLCFTFTR